MSLLELQVELLMNFATWRNLLLLEALHNQSRAGQ